MVFHGVSNKEPQTTQTTTSKRSLPRYGGGKIKQRVGCLPPRGFSLVHRWWWDSSDGPNLHVSVTGIWVVLIPILIGFNTTPSGWSMKSKQLMTVFMWCSCYFDPFWFDVHIVVWWYDVHMMLPLWSSYASMVLMWSKCDPKLDRTSRHLQMCCWVWIWPASRIRCDVARLSRLASCIDQVQQTMKNIAIYIYRLYCKLWIFYIEMW